MHNIINVTNGVNITSEYVSSLLNTFDDVTFIVKNGGWARFIDLPTSGISEGSVIKIERYSSWGTQVRFENTTISLEPNKVTTFIFKNGTWSI
ncbi:hypothetical protein MNB_ARC-1_1217 [hydrothermal vent metagenome]|uniref:Metalloprotease StcE beta-sandwich domain-containing protein n=1 Tax=hydrothermal vent metagenome TaxID=652676 RepID=A0A3B1E2I2_9ZZZZ